MNIKSTINTFTKELLSLIIAFCVGIFTITYLLNLPGLITGNYNIVNEYYIKNFITSIPTDFFFVLVYFLTAGIFIKILKINSNISKTLIVGLITILLTGIACYYFKSRKLTNNFFSRWFHSVGYSSVVYDLILLVFIYICFLFIKNKINKPV